MRRQHHPLFRLTLQQLPLLRRGYRFRALIMETGHLHRPRREIKHHLILGDLLYLHCPPISADTLASKALTQLRQYRASRLYRRDMRERRLCHISKGINRLLRCTSSHHQARLRLRSLMPCPNTRRQSNTNKDLHREAHRRHSSSNMTLDDSP